MVDSRPAGARVFVDGKLVGTTPLLIDAVAVGDHAVRLELDGFNPWTASTKVVGRRTSPVSGRWSSADGMKEAILALEDGTIYRGLAAGAEGETRGEVVFNTSLTGYQEILTDPSYSGRS